MFALTLANNLFLFAAAPKAAGDDASADGDDILDPSADKEELEEEDMEDEDLDELAEEEEEEEEELDDEKDY